MKIDLSGRIAVVTGASRKIGIGAAIARTLATAGADVFLTYFLPYDEDQPWRSNPQEAEELLAHLHSLGVRAYGMEANLAQPETPARVFDAVEGRLGRVSILINNATHSEDGDIGVLDAAQLDRHYAVNVRGMALLCKEFVQRWPGGSGGRIINMSSGQGAGPMPGELAYIATKGAVEAFTTSLAAGVARQGITANAIDPGPVDTGWMNEELKARLVAQAPLGRVGMPQDIASLICFLASAQADWITGQVLHARGGF